MTDSPPSPVHAQPWEKVRHEFARGEVAAREPPLDNRRSRRKPRQSAPGCDLARGGDRRTPKADQSSREMTDREIYMNAPEGATREQLAEYIVAACGGDEDLRARVESLFATEAELGSSFLATLVPDPHPGWAGAEELGLEGRVVGNYELQEVIGEGGFGTVYLADQSQPVSRQVALKVIKLGMDTRQVIARFEAERQALALMDHPNIAKVFDAGATESGRPYFVMERVNGVPINRFCEDGGLSINARLRLFIEVCRAVQHAHQKGVIHRDLKPSNILVSADDGSAMPKVIDFGVAKATGAQLTDKTLHSGDGQVLGTPSYASPEQVEAGSLDIDTRSDIYSLGVVLYELLTGRTPVSAEDVRSSSWSDLVQMIRERQPRRPSAVAATPGRPPSGPPGTGPMKVAKQIAGDLDWIVLKCLEKDRSRRYDSVSALVADLESHLADRTVSARPPTLGYRLRKYAVRNRRLLASGIAIAASLLAATAVSTWQAVKARAAESVASGERDRANATAQALAREVKRTYFNSMLLGASELRLGNGDRFARITAPYRRVSHLIEDPRGWEWFYLQGYSEQSDSVWKAHSGPVSACAWSADGRWGATAGEDGRIVIYGEGGDAIQDVVSGARAPVRALAWSIEGTLAAARDDGVVALWDVGQRRCRAELRGHFGAIRSMDWSPDGRRIASAGDDRQLIIWDVASAAPLRSVSSFAAINSVAWRPGVEQVAYAHSDMQGQVYLMDLSTMEAARIYEAVDAGGVYALSWDGHGGGLAIGTGDDGVRIWSEGGTAHFPGHIGTVRALDWHGGGGGLASVGDDLSLRVLENPSSSPPEAEGEELRQRILLGHRSPVGCVAWSDVAGTLLTGGDDGSVRFWTPGEQRNGEVLIDRLPSYAQALDWSADGAMIAVTGWEYDAVRIFDRRGGGEWGIEPATAGAKSVLWHPELPSRLITGSEEHGLVLWDVARGGMERIAAISGADADVVALSRPRGRYAISVDHGGSARLWDLETLAEREPKLRLANQGPDGRPSILAAAWSPGGEWLAGGGFGGALDLWDGQDFEPVRRLRPGGGGDVLAVDFSPDGGRVVIGDRRGFVEVFDIDGTSLHRVQAHRQKEVKSVRWQPGDGGRIASAGQDGSIRVIDAETYDLALEIQAHENEMYRIAWSPDGRSIAGSGWGNQLRLWSASGEAAAGVAPGLSPSDRGGEAVAAELMFRVWSGTQPAPDAEELTMLAGDVERQLKAAPGDPFLLATKGLIAAAEGDLDLAARLLSMGAEPSSALAGGARKRVRIARAAVLRRSGRLEEAAEANREALGFPPRPGRTPGEQIDLSAYYTERLDADLYDTHENSLAALPGSIGGRGDAGRAYDVRGIVHASATFAKVRGYWRGQPLPYPRSVEGIAIGMKCNRIFFLQGAGAQSEEDGLRIGHYAIHLAGREQPEIVPIHFAVPVAEEGEGGARRDAARVWDWWYPNDRPLPEAVAWVGANPAATAHSRRLVLSEYVWENADPEVAVVGIDFVSANTESAPFLIAVTVEPGRGD